MNEIKQWKQMEVEHHIQELVVYNFINLMQSNLLILNLLCTLYPKSFLPQQWKYIYFLHVLLKFNLLIVLMFNYNY